jgi:hypothetical protein
VYLHGTKADLAVGDLPLSGRESNFEAGRVMNYVYFTATLDAAVWGAELANGDGRGSGKEIGGPQNCTSRDTGGTMARESVKSELCDPQGGAAGLALYSVCDQEPLGVELL